MAIPGPEQSLTISAIIDWDSAIFALYFISCVPPWWIWVDDDNDDDEEDES